MARSHCRRCSADKQDGRCSNCIIGAVALEIKAPESTDWDTLGFQLRTIHSVFYRFMNVAMMHDTKAWMAHKQDGIDLKIYSYPAVMAERKEAVAWREKKAAELAGSADALRKKAEKAR